MILVGLSNVECAVEKSYFIGGIDVVVVDSSLTLSDETKEEIKRASKIEAFSALTLPIDDNDAIRGAISCVAALGYRMRIKVRHQGEGKVILVLEVYGRLAKIVRVTGESVVSKKVLKGVKRVIGGYYLGEVTLREAEDEAKKLLYGLGYAEASVVARWCENEEGDGEIRLLIKRGVVFYTQKVNFQGVSRGDVEVLSGQMGLYGQNRLRWRRVLYLFGRDIGGGALGSAFYRIYCKLRRRQYFTEKEVDLSCRMIAEFYYAQGYLNVKVEPEVLLARKRGLAYVTFRVEKGRQYRIRSIRWEGEKSYEAGELNEWLGLKVGMIYRPLLLEEQLNSLTHPKGLQKRYEKTVAMLVGQSAFIQGVVDDGVDLVIRIQEIKRPTVRYIVVTPDGLDPRIVRNILASHDVVSGQPFQRYGLLGAQHEMMSSHLIDGENLDLRPLVVNDESVDLVCSVPMGDRALNFGFNLDMKSGVDAFFAMENLNLWKIFALKLPTKGSHGLMMKLFYEWANGSKGKPLIWEIGFSNPFVFIGRQRFKFDASCRYSHSLDRTHHPYQGSEAKIGIGQQTNVGIYRYGKELNLLYGKGVLAQSDALNGLTIRRLHAKLVLSKSSVNHWFYPTQGSYWGIIGSVIMPLPYRQVALRPMVTCRYYSAQRGFVWMHHLGSGLNRDYGTGFGHFFLGGQMDAKPNIYFLQDGHYVPIRGYKDAITFMDSKRGGNCFFHYTLELRYSLSATNYVFGFLDLGTVGLLSSKQEVKTRSLASFGVGVRQLIPFFGVLSFDISCNLQGQWQIDFRIKRPESF